MDSISLNDNILDCIDYNIAVMVLRNINRDKHPDVWERMKKELKDSVDIMLEDMMYELDEHFNEVWAAAFPDEE